MKRILVIGLVLVLLLAAIGGAAWWFFLRIPGYVSPAAYLPADTLFYAEVPNGTKTLLHYQTSKLKQIVESDEVRAMFGYLTDTLSKDSGNAKAGDKLAKLNKARDSFVQALGGTSFVAVTQFDAASTLTAMHMGKETQTNVEQAFGGVIGFYHSPQAGKNLDDFVTRIKELTADAAANDSFKQGDGSHGGVNYHYMELNDKKTTFRLCRAHWKDWDLFSFGEKPLTDFIDRMAAGGKDSLASNPDYVSVMKQVDQNGDVLIYTNAGKLFGSFAEFISKMGNGQFSMEPVAKIYREMAVMKSFAWSFNFDQGDLVEKLSVNIPKGTSFYGMSDKPVNRKVLGFTSPDTVLFNDSNIDWEAYYNQQSKLYEEMSKTAGANADASKKFNPYQMIETQMQAQGLDLHENVLKAIGPAIGYVLDWPQGQEYPDVLLVVGLQHEDKFVPVYERLSGMVAALVTMVQGKSEKFSTGDFNGITLSSQTYPKISPTLFKSKEFFGVSLTGSGAMRLLSGKAKALTEQELLGGIKPGGELQHIAYARLDEISGRSYKLLKPYLTDYLHKSEDAEMQHLADKLPAELVTAKLLGSWHAGAWQNGDFRSSELRSPVGSGIFALGTGIGAGVMVSALHKAKLATEAAQQAAASQALPGAAGANSAPAAAPDVAPVQPAQTTASPAQ